MTKCMYSAGPCLVDHKSEKHPVLSTANATATANSTTTTQRCRNVSESGTALPSPPFPSLPLASPPFPDPSPPLP